MHRYLLPVGLVTLVGLPIALSQQPAPGGPAYQIVLHSRNAEAKPSRTRDAQTGGGSIVVEQPEPNTIVVTMGGSVVVGSSCCGSVASIDFHLSEELEIVPTRSGVRPPRVGLIGRVVGTLQSTDSVSCLKKCCGSAQQEHAVASLGSGEASLLTINVPMSSVSCGQELAINNRDGPVECQAASGRFHLTGSFRISATQGNGVFHRRFAAADFDPAPQLDAFWSDALKPFRAVPRRDFGFKAVLRVIEEPAPAVMPEKGK
jgi:hypothetical protein